MQMREANTQVPRNIRKARTMPPKKGKRRLMQDPVLHSQRVTRPRKRSRNTSPSPSMRTRALLKTRTITSRCSTSTKLLVSTSSQPPSCSKRVLIISLNAEHGVTEEHIQSLVHLGTFALATLAHNSGMTAGHAEEDSEEEQGAEEEHPQQ